MQNEDTPIGSAGKIRTFTGRLVNPFDLKDDDIRIEDIAHSLSQTCRFTGHTRNFYSVGEHCILVASFMPRGNYRLKLAALLHDASEAYFGDMAGPMKQRAELAGYKKAEHNAGFRILEHFGIYLDPREQAIVKQADSDAYHIERNCLIQTGDMEGYANDSGLLLGSERPQVIEALYIQLFEAFYGQLINYNLQASPLVH